MKTMPRELTEATQPMTCICMREPRCIHVIEHELFIECGKHPGFGVDRKRVCSQKEVSR